MDGALLEYLQKSLVGTYIALLDKLPRYNGSKEWPVRPFRF